MNRNDLYFPILTEDDIKRFWKHIDIKESNNCWNWKRSTVRPSFGLNHRLHMSSRISYFLTYGPFVDSLLVLHTCDNELCVNPSHLELGSNRKNIQDSFDRGLRSNNSILHLLSRKLSDNDLKEIKRLYKNDHLSQQKIAIRFNVSRQLISKIILGLR